MGVYVLQGVPTLQNRAGRDPRNSVTKALEKIMKTLIWFCCLLMMVGIAAATIIHVPSQYPTIQAGVNAAHQGDTVQVASGTYTENVQLTEGISLFGSGWDTTTIDGGGLADVVSALFVNYVVVDGFTIQNSQQGGSTPGNVGVFFNPHSGFGSKILRNCRIRHNGQGVQIWNDFGGASYIEHNLICQNLYNGFYPYLGVTQLTNNTIVSNGQDGYNDWSGGGSVIIRNNIFANNGRYGIFKHRDTPVQISYNDVWGNAQGAYYEGYSGPATPFVPNPGTGEIAANPLFANPPEDLHLTWASFPVPDSTRSHCIDAGDPNLPLDPDHTRADVGALYFDQSYPDLIVTLTPYGTPIIIPQAGGEFDFNFRVDFNETPPTFTFHAWFMLQAPDSSWLGPVMGPIPLPAQEPGTFIEFDTTYVVESGLPTGIYIFESRIGLYPNWAWDTDSFTFEIVEDSTSVNPINNIPAKFILLSNYPNPFNPITTFTFTLPVATHATLDLYDITGRHLTTLFSGFCQTGTHQISFNGSELSSGVYFCQLKAGESSTVRKILLIK